MKIPVILIHEGVLRRLKEQELAFFEEQLVPNAVPWDDGVDGTKFQEHLCVKAETFRPHLLFDVAPHDVRQSDRLDPRKCVASPCGRFLYLTQTLPRGEALSIVEGRRRGRVYFDGDVVLPVLAEVQDSETPKVVMSLAPMEVFTQREALRLAFGHVVVGGLGLGWLLTKVCALPQVKTVTVVEQSQALLQWLGPVLRGRYPELAKVQNWLCGDVIAFLKASPDWWSDDRCFLLDIWDKYGEASDDATFQELKKYFKHLWGWGDLGRE